MSVKLLGGFKSNTKILFKYKNKIEVDYIGNLLNKKLEIYNGNNFKESIIKEYNEIIDCYKLRILDKITLKYQDTTIYSNNIWLNVLKKNEEKMLLKYIPINLLNENYIINNKKEYEIQSVLKLYRNKYVYYNIINSEHIYCNGIKFLINNNIENNIKMEAKLINKNK